MTDRRLYSVVLAEAAERELQRNVALTVAAPDAARDAAAQVSGWMQRVRIERYPLPAPSVVGSYAPG